ncbi:acetamidase/formamidase family protein [Streptomyces sp. DG2A-72]|uniref:acetamidase/formamidase family protein n=1 Tax=Streptomyces sp. DG2A-72 TaxID=3051386 RepID=UPI00265C253F|nr:acetamidase/formamidase family protein [Streptomyces sp. DG2A-72]MDO0931205.1 acetamidase/formamidase family protein [Streptomyces sp. DG2A-72]
MSDPRILTVRPEPGEYAWTFGGVPPVARIAPGTVLDLYTEDCFAGRVRSEKDLVTQVCEFPFLNPQTGPFHIEGAEPGDTVAVRGDGLDLATRPDPPYGPVPGARQRHRGRTDPRPDARHRGRGSRQPGGALGPGTRRARRQHMDTPEMRAGVTCYLGVNVECALLSLGDGHARQGEGETCGVAVECAMNTVVIVELLKGLATPWPRIESDTHIISTGSARPLEDAFRISQLDLVRWLVRDYGFSELDAYQFATQCVESPLANVCDTNYTCVAKLRKQWLPARETHRGVHARLRETAATLRN